jgi:basic membrane protein A
MARLVAVLAVFAMLAAACANDNGGGGGGGGSETTSAALPGAGMTGCEVTDTGGIDDKSFNATAYKGLTDAQDQLGVEAKYVESQTQQDYDPNIQAYIGQCDLIVTVGFLLGDATEAAAKANPDQKFAIVDFAYEKTYPNILALTFQTDQASFLAGYLAAGMTKSGKVGTFGGLNIPTVTIFMNGFWAGVQKYNEDNGTDVQVLGWDGADQKGGTFTGDFENQDNGRRVTEDLISEGADIVMPVAGPVGLGAAAAAQDAGGVNLIWVDTDGFVSASEYGSLFLTSVEKKMDVAVFDAMKSVVDGTYQGGIYSGTLENGGVGIAPYHDFDSQIPDELKSKIDELKQGIIDGSVSVDYNNYLK